MVHTFSKHLPRSLLFLPPYPPSFFLFSRLRKTTQQPLHSTRHRDHGILPRSTKYSTFPHEAAERPQAQPSTPFSLTRLVCRPTNVKDNPIAACTRSNLCAGGISHETVPLLCLRLVGPADRNSASLGPPRRRVTSTFAPYRRIDPFLGACLERWAVKRTAWSMSLLIVSDGLMAKQRKSSIEHASEGYSSRSRGRLNAAHHSAGLTRL